MDEARRTNYCSSTGMVASVWQLTYQGEDGDGRRGGGDERGEEVEHRHLDPCSDLPTTKQKGEKFSDHKISESVEGVRRNERGESR
jgi:hypothetical protein